MGAVLGASVRFPTFAVVSVAVVILYGAIVLVASKLGAAIIGAVIAFFALQLGYAIAFAVQTMMERRARNGADHER